MSRTEEYALERMTASMGRSEQSEMRRAMQQACDDATMRGILEDNRNSVFLPAPRSAATVVPVGAGKVVDGEAAQQGHGWVDPVPLERRDWASMTKAEIEQRDKEWAKEFAGRREKRSSE
jgi:hypothetical protein